MEPPPSSLSSTAVATSTIPAATAPAPPPPHVTASYPESLDSSPRSRTTDGWDELPAPSGGGSAVSSKLRLMCSYGGHILPRPHDKSLCYMGGDTRIVVVDRNSTLASLVARLSNTLLNGRSFTLKYQLPSEDLDSLISVTTDEDLDNMIEEYDRTISASNSTKPSRLRLFLFTAKPEATQSMGQILESSAKSDDWFLNALNSAGLLNRGFSDSDTNVNRLLGLDDALAFRSNSDENANNLDSSVRDRDGDGSVKSAKQQQQQQQQQQIQQPPPQQQGGQDVHCLPDSPMLDTSSSFGSTSSSPSLANLPPIRVHVEESSGVRATQDQRLGIEEQFARFNVGNKQPQHQQEDGFAAISSPPPMPVTIALPAAPVGTTTVSNELQARVFSDDERSDHGVPAGFRKPPTPRSQQQNPPPQQAHHLKSNSGGGNELPSPHSVSSDSGMNNPMFHQRPSVYQEPIVQMPSGSTVVAGMINPSDPSTLLSQIQNQTQDPGYILHSQFEQQSQPQPQPQQQQQQFIHAAAAPQYIHHHPSSGLPVQTYIQVYPSQQQQQQPQSFHRHPGQLDQQPYPVYYVTSQAPPRPYSMPVPQSGSVSEPQGSLPTNHNHPQVAPNSTMMVPPPNNLMRSVPGGKPEMQQAGIYTTAPGLGMVHQIPTSQQQYVAYSQIHHPPQSGSTGNPNYGYEYADNAHKQIYYTQPLGHAQYQTMTGLPPAMVIPDSSAAAKLPVENMTQQIRSSQPL